MAATRAERRDPSGALSGGRPEASRGQKPAASGPRRRVRAAISGERATCGLVAFQLSVAPEHVVFVKGVLEASDGLASLFADRGGDLRIASPREREAELRELLSDLSEELGGTWGVAPTSAIDDGLPGPAVTPAARDLENDAPRHQGAPQAPPPDR